MKYVAVTGAYGGMGRAVVTALAKRGYFVFAIDRRTEESGNERILPITAEALERRPPLWR